MGKQVWCFLFLFNILLYYPQGTKARPLYTDQSYGIEYSFLSRDQYVIDKTTDSIHDIHSYESLHLLTYYYIPFEYMRFGLGIGIDKYQIADKYNVVFNGQYGPSGLLRLNIFSPLMVQNTICFTTEVEFLHVRNKNYLHYLYKSFFWYFGGGAIFQLGPIFNVEVGAKAYITYSEEEKRRNVPYASIKNKNKFRSYITFSLCSSEGSYGSLSFVLSPKVSKGNKKLLNEASIGCSIGTYFPATIANSISNRAKYKEIKNK